MQFVSSQSAMGIISACAERTSSHAGHNEYPADYLRVCGADHRFYRVPEGIEGLSPRVRSGRRDPDPGGRQTGIISACAERTA